MHRHFCICTSSYKDTAMSVCLCVCVSLSLSLHRYTLLCANMSVHAQMCTNSLTLFSYHVYICAKMSAHAQMCTVTKKHVMFAYWSIFCCGLISCSQASMHMHLEKFSRNLIKLYWRKRGKNPSLSRWIHVKPRAMVFLFNRNVYLQDKFFCFVFHMSTWRSYTCVFIAWHACLHKEDKRRQNITIRIYMYTHIHHTHAHIQHTHIHTHTHLHTDMNTHMDTHTHA